MSAKMRKDAKRLAGQGRKGDTHLLHITRPELLELMATGLVTVNPKTGLPEARNLSPKGLLKSGVKFARKVNPIFDWSSDALSWMPGSPASAVAAIESDATTKPYGTDASVWDIFAGGTKLSQDPDQRRIGRTVGSAFAGYGLGEAFGAATAAEGGAVGAEAGGGTVAAEEAGLAAYNPNAASGASAGASGGGASMPPAVAENPETLRSWGMTETSPGVWEATGSPAVNNPGDMTTPGAEDELFMSQMAGPQGIDSAPFIENNLSAELAAGSPAQPSYWDQFLDFWRKRGWKANLRSGMHLYSGLSGLAEARALEKMAANADPMAGVRQQSAAELEALRRDPSRLTGTPTYKAGEQAIMRSMASQGYLGSGNMMHALQEYGGKAYDTEIGRLERLASSPGALQQQQMQMAAQQQKSRSLASLGFMAAGL